MALYENYSADDLNRVLTLSKWVLGFLAMLTAAAGVFNQWVTDRIATLQKGDKAKAQQRLQLTEAELEQTKAKTVEVSARLSKLTSPRHLTSEQIEQLRVSLAGGPKGKVVLTFLSVEKDAQHYCKEISDVLAQCGFDVSTPPKLWLQLAFDDLFIVVRDVQNSPPHAVHIQNCFKAAGIRVRGFEDPNLFTQFQEAIPEEAAIFVVSNRE